MNKTELINAVARSTGTTRKEAEAAVCAALEAMTEALKRGEKVQLVGFGGFEVKERAARAARNPRTGEEIEIAASKAVTFRPGKTLKEALNS